jgi:hypothetical protein
LLAGERWLYLGTVLDLWSKELIGFAIAAAHVVGLVAGNAIMRTGRGSGVADRNRWSVLTTA